MARPQDLRPGEARKLERRDGFRYLIHRPGEHPLYLVYEEDPRRNSVDALGAFSTWHAAQGAVRARHTIAAAG